MPLRHVGWRVEEDGEVEGLGVHVLEANGKMLQTNTAAKWLYL